jgi:hypothetical protein
LVIHSCGEFPRPKPFAHALANAGSPLAVTAGLRHQAGHQLLKFLLMKIEPQQAEIRRYLPNSRPISPGRFPGSSS